jgi:hypothetical protein
MRVGMATTKVLLIRLKSLVFSKYLVKLHHVKKHPNPRNISIVPRWKTPLIR